MVGILVHGNNHFILSGPVPDEAAAVALARHWSIIQIGDQKSPALEQWELRTKEFRENLEWAVIVPGDREPSPGVALLLAELSARGIAIRTCSRGCW
jgi:beta-phosphoglucomutase-like phosphatase (HAD superfamily)